MGVDLVQPVAMRSAVFCVVCNLSMCVSAASGRAHWRAACSAAGCQGLNRAASEVRFRGENSRKFRLKVWHDMVLQTHEYPKNTPISHTATIAVIPLTRPNATCHLPLFWCPFSIKEKH